jgi:hypothetical protein
MEDALSIRITKNNRKTLRIARRLVGSAWLGQFLLPLATLAPFFIVPIHAYAQFSSSIEGTVTDTSGALVPNATITLSNPATGTSLTAKSSSSGHYQFPALPSSDFTLVVSAPGFATLTQQKVKTEVALTSTVNVKLEVGASTTEITVSDAPAPLQLADGQISAVISAREVQDLPVASRNFFNLVVLTPGVTGTVSGGSQGYAQSQADIFNNELGVNLNAGGQRAESNSFLIDSAPVNSGPRRGVVNINPNVESVQELRVQVNNYTAEYGGNAGATVNVITRQGSNAFHGSVDEFHQDNALVARNYFDGPKVTVFRRNEFGGSIGGPIYKNHTFFFGSVDVLRSSAPSSYLATAYTPAFISFLQTARPKAISTKILSTYKPSITTNAGQVTAGSVAGQDCSALPSPSQNITTVLGQVPCNLAVTGNGNFAASTPRNGLQWNARVDQVFRGGRDRIYANFFRTTLDVQNLNVYPDFATPNPSHTFYGNVSELHTFSANLLNQVRYSYTRTFGAVQCVHCDIPSIGISGTTGFGGFGPFPYVQNNFEGADTVTLIRGSHNIHFGGSLTRVESNANGLQAFQRPGFYFPDPLSFAADQPLAESGLAANLTTGKITGAIYNDRRQFFSFFGQDDFQVRPNLKLNLGLRYESFGNFNEVNPDTTNIVFQGGSTFQQQIANAKVAVLNKALLSNLKNNFGPKFGFAYDVGGKGKLAIRGGFGINYDIPSDQIFPPGPSNPPVIAFVNLSTQTPPFVPVYGLGASATAPFNFPAPVVQVGVDAKGGPTFTKAGLQVIDPHLKTEYSENYSLGLQGNLGRSWIAELNYVGSVGRNQYESTEVNRFNGDLIQNKGNLTRLNTSFGGIEYAQGNFSSSYNGMTAAIRNRDIHGLNTQIAYTLGKALDQASTAGGTGTAINGNDLNIVDPTNPAAEHARADFDVRQQLSISLLYELPGSRLGNGLLRGVLGGWEVADITILQSGLPLSVFCSRQFQFGTNANGSTNFSKNVGCDYNADGFNYDRPNSPVSGNTLRGITRKQYLAGIFPCAVGGSLCSNVFSAPALGQEGTLGRNTYQNPGYANSDVSLLKNTRFAAYGRDGLNFQFRAEALNIFNRTNLGFAHGDINGSNFGQSTSANPSRRFQFGARVIF